MIAIIIIIICIIIIIAIIIITIIIIIIIVIIISIINTISISIVCIIFCWCERCQWWYCYNCCKCHEVALSWRRGACVEMCRCLMGCQGCQGRGERYPHDTDKHRQDINSVLHKSAVLFLECFLGVTPRGIYWGLRWHRASHPYLYIT